MKIPSVSTIQKFDEIIEIFGNPQKFAAKLAEIKALEDFVNGKLKQWEGLEDIDTLKSQAKAKSQEAVELRTAGERILFDARSEADRIVSDAKNEAESIVSEAQELSTSTTKAAGDLSTEQAKVRSENDSAKELMASATKLELKARLLIEDAEKMRSEYQRRLDEASKLLRGNV